MDEQSVLRDVSLPSDDAPQVQMPAADVRPPLEYALALDAICAGFRPDDRVYVATDSPTLLQAVLARHDCLLTHESALDGTLRHGDQDVETIAGPEGVISRSVDRVLVLDPGSAELLRQVVDATGDSCPHDCLVGNPYSFNRVEDRAVDGWLVPRRARRAYEAVGFETAVVGYHGPRAILQSLAGRLWQSLGRPDRRDEYTHRMRAAYREDRLPLALLSCIVHVAARPEGARE